MKYRDCITKFTTAAELLQSKEDNTDRTNIIIINYYGAKITANKV